MKVSDLRISAKKMKLKRFYKLKKEDLKRTVENRASELICRFLRYLRGFKIRFSNEICPFSMEVPLKSNRFVSMINGKIYFYTFDMLCVHVRRSKLDPFTRTEFSEFDMLRIGKRCAEHKIQAIQAFPDIVHQPEFESEAGNDLMNFFEHELGSEIQSYLNFTEYRDYTECGDLFFGVVQPNIHSIVSGMFSHCSRRSSVVLMHALRIAIGPTLFPNSERAKSSNSVDLLTRSLSNLISTFVPSNSLHVIHSNAIRGDPV